jgi:hypothetical protein
MNERTGSILRRPQTLSFCFAVCTLLFLLNACAAAAQESTDLPANTIQKTALTADEIASRLQDKNHQREVALQKFQGTRIYRVHYQGFFGTREAEMVVSCTYVSPNTKEFVVLSQTGTKFILNHVINGLLEGEKEAAIGENRQRTSLTSRNYNFTLDETATAIEPSQYVLNVIPKHDNKFLYRGKIWVDATDFAVTRIEAEPAKSPSFWVKKTTVRHRYEKVGDFWLPAENNSESIMRMGGRALLSIEYKDYRVTDTAGAKPTETISGK